MSTWRSSVPSNGWAGPRDVTRRAEKPWDSGAILRALNTAADTWTSFPDRTRLAGPGRDALAADLSAAADWAGILIGDAHRRGWRLETKRVSAGIHGGQTIPAAAYLDTPQQA